MKTIGNINNNKVNGINIYHVVFSLRSFLTSEDQHISLENNNGQSVQLEKYEKKKFIVSLSLNITHSLIRELLVGLNNCLL